MSIIITGGSGFIGKNFISLWKKKYKEKIINIDIQSYAANFFRTNKQEDYLYKVNIKDKKKIKKIIFQHQPRAIINFAAETHVDRSIDYAEKFVETNVMGTLNLLNCSREYINKKKIKKFKFIHISTDEVFGSLKKREKSFTEKSSYDPQNPYSATKAASDHLIRSFINTYKFPGIITNCSNNFGKFQMPEKLIPLVIYKAFLKQKIPIYGNGKQIRDWIYVEDHCSGILKVLNKGKLGESYNIGGGNEISNINLVKKILKIINVNVNGNFDYLKLISFVKDRLGHDKRYSINSKKIKNKLKWNPKFKFELALENTIKWYLKTNLLKKHKKFNKDFENWLSKKYN